MRALGPAQICGAGVCILTRSPGDSDPALQSLAPHPQKVGFFSFGILQLRKLRPREVEFVVQDQR